MDNGPEKESIDGHAGDLKNPPPAANSIGYIKQYIDASAESADRARFVLLVMVTASVLAFVAIWNSRPQGWLNARLTVATNALKFYDSNDLTGKKILLDAAAIEREVWPRFFSQPEYDSLAEQKDKDEYRQNRREAFERAKEFVELNFVRQSRFANLEHLQRYVEFLERTRTEKVLSVTVPFFGIVFDINDLGIFAGLTFVIVLLLFRFSRLRELRNVRLVFQQARTVEHMELCYNLLAMQQVLTTPPQLDPKQLDGKFWSISGWRELFWMFVPKILSLLPFLTHLRIFIHDVRTYEDVEKIYPGTVTSLLLSGIFLGVNILLTGLCIYLGWKVDKTWNNHARYIIEHRDVPPNMREPEQLPVAG